MYNSEADPDTNPRVGGGDRHWCITLYFNMPARGAIWSRYATASLQWGLWTNSTLKNISAFKSF